MPRGPSPGYPDSVKSMVGTNGHSGSHTLREPDLKQLETRLHNLEPLESLLESDISLIERH